MSFFEVIMLLCFGAAWPFSIYKSWHSRSNKGKSLVFLIVVLLGYICGIFHKFLYAYDIVVLLYMINASMVIVDIGFYFRNARKLG